MNLIFLVTYFGTLSGFLYAINENPMAHFIIRRDLEEISKVEVTDDMYYVLLFIILALWPVAAVAKVVDEIKNEIKGKE